MTLSCNAHASTLDNPTIRKANPLPSSTVKKDPNRTKTHVFPFPVQANQAFNCNKAENERKFVEANDGQAIDIPIDTKFVEAIARNIARSQTEYEQDVI